MIKYAMSLVDLRLEGRWESKGVAVFYLQLTLDMCHLILYCAFFAVVFSAYGIPLHLVRDLYWTLRNFQHRVRDFLRFRRLTANMNAQFPDATVQDVERVGGVCIICREELTGASTGTDSDSGTVGTGNEDGGQQEGQAARSAPITTMTPTSTGGTNKKLGCGHVFHLHCLRSWLERQQNCPICRATVTPAINVQEIHNGRDNPHHHHQRHAGGGDRAAAAGNNNNNLNVHDGVLPLGGMRHRVRVERVPLETLVARIVDDEAEARRRSTGDTNGTSGQPSSGTTTTTTTNTTATTSTAGDGERYTRGRVMPSLSPEQQQHIRALMQHRQQQQQQLQQMYNTAIGTPPPAAVPPPSAAAQQAYTPPTMMMMPSPSPTSPYLHHHNQPYPMMVMLPSPSLPQQQPVTLEQHQAALAAATAAVHAARSATPSTTGDGGFSNMCPGDTPSQFNNNNNNNNNAAVTSTSSAHQASAEAVERLLEQQLSSVKSYLQRVRGQQQQLQPSGRSMNEEGGDTRKSLVNTLVGGGVMTSPSPPVAIAMVGGETEQVGGSGSRSRSVRTTMIPSGGGSEEEKKKVEEEEEEEQGPRRVNSRPVCFSDESE